MEESADDMTAADTAPSPMKEMKDGQRNCRHMGRMRLSILSGIGSSPSYSVAFQSETGWGGGGGGRGGREGGGDWRYVWLAEDVQVRKNINRKTEIHRRDSRTDRYIGG